MKLFKKMLKSKLVNVNDPDYPKYGLHLFAENTPTPCHNTMLFNKLARQETEIYAIDSIPTSCKLTESQMTVAQNWKQSDTGGFTKTLQLKTDAKVMLTINTDIQKRLVNDHIGMVKHFEIIDNDIATIFIEFNYVNAGRN